MTDQRPPNGTIPGYLPILLGILAIAILVLIVVFTVPGGADPMAVTPVATAAP